MLLVSSHLGETKSIETRPKIRKTETSRARFVSRRPNRYLVRLRTLVSSFAGSSFDVSVTVCQPISIPDWQLVGLSFTTHYVQRSCLQPFVE